MLEAMQEEPNRERVWGQLSFKKQLNKNYFKMEKNISLSKASVSKSPASD